MSYRDDHDAAIARIDALERQLGEVSEHNTKLQAKVSRLQREIRRLEGKEDDTVQFTPASGGPEMPRWIAVATQALGFIVFTAIALILIFGVTAPD